MRLFLTFEGGEGSGKTTQIHLLAEALKKRGFPCLLTREPGGTEIGAEIRRILLDGKNHRLSPLSELMLYAADRAQHIEETIAPALAENRIVLCDRFTDATVAYQGFGRHLDLKLITELNQLATGGLKPNRTFLLDLPVEIGLARATARLERQKSSEGRFEAEALAFHEKVRQGYLRLAREEPERFRVFDATMEIEALHGKILEEIESLGIKKP
ncbi:MAG: dTMP kinase [Deltaproteobacteria bacterium]|nr:dTMP kinase [Deltaproteobacteria bacterium]